LLYIFILAQAQGQSFALYEANQSSLFKEGKTGKVNVLMVNRSTSKVLQRYRDKLSSLDQDSLFKSSKGILSH
jgi:hypothetical protein